MKKLFISFIILLVASVCSAEVWEGKWIKTKDDTIEYFVKGVSAGFKVIKNTSNTGEQFRMFDPNGRMFECENGLGYCREIVEQRYRDLQEFNTYVKSK